MTPDEAKALLPNVLAEFEHALSDVLAVVQDPPVGLVQMVTDRYLAGCEEFSGDWTSKTPAWCEAEAAEELADLVTYMAFRRVLSRTDKADAARPSGARTRTPVPHNTPPKGARVNDATTPEVTAQGLHPAFDAVGQVVALILELEDDLAQIPAGEEMVRRAKKARATLLAE